MQKKYKRAIIISSVSLVLLTLLLVLLGLATVELDQYALNYSNILSNYADSRVYGPGLYYIGVSNKFIRINKNLQTIYFNNLTTFTSDFYALTANLQISYLFNFSTSDFNTINNFYTLMGSDPQLILKPLMKNQILVLLSQKNSSYYQTSNQSASSLQSHIAARIQVAVSQWISTTVSVIIESLVCVGSSSNTQMIDREIQSLVHDLERVSSEKVELSGYFNSVFAKKQFEINSAMTAIQNKAANLQRILNLYGKGNGLKIGQILYENTAYKYNPNLLTILEQLSIIGNTTFPS